MKRFGIAVFALLLCGCGWMNKETPKTETPTTTETKTSEMKDLFSYFDEKGVVLENAQDMEVVDMNAHEGKTFKYEGNDVYLYRMNLKDETVKKWMDEISSTGKVTINQEGQDGSYDAVINGEYLMVTPSGNDLKTLSEVFKKYEIK